jgi:hypothetical protein
MKAICKKPLDNRMTVDKIYDVIYTPLGYFSPTHHTVFKYYLIADNGDKIFLSKSLLENKDYFLGIDEVRDTILKDLGID